MYNHYQNVICGNLIFPIGRFNVVQSIIMGWVGVEGDIQRWKREAKEWGDQVKKNEEVVEKLEKKREQYEGELRMFL